MMRCVLCGEDIDLHSEHHLPTTSGDAVHLSCAERDAKAAWRWRHGLALVHAISGVAVTTAVWLLDVHAWWLIALVLACSHVMLHQRWWYFFRKDLCQWAFSKRH